MHPIFFQFGLGSYAYSFYCLFLKRKKKSTVLHQEQFCKKGPEGPGGQKVESKSCKCDLTAINAQLHPWLYYHEDSQQVQGSDLFPLVLHLRYCVQFGASR